MDSGALIAYLQGEPGGNEVALLLADTQNALSVHAVNLTEVYYHFLRAFDEPTADNAINDLISDGMIVREDLDMSFWKSVGKLKARGRLSLADCFCIALAQRLSCEVVTTDHHEFDPLVSLNLCTFRFIR